MLTVNLEFNLTVGTYTYHSTYLLYYYLLAGTYHALKWPGYLLPIILSEASQKCRIQPINFS